MKRLTTGAVALLVVLGLAAPAAQAAPPVTVYPTPGDRFEQPRTQIAFRGIPADGIGAITVTGSRSGAHAGRIVADSDGNGGSWLPDRPFDPGEKVTVTTGLGIVGGTNGTFSFSIEHPGPNLVPQVLPVAGGPSAAQHFHSQPGLAPATVEVTTDTAPASEGDIFVAPQFGPVQNGPMILDPSGQLVWFDPIPIGNQTIVTDFRTQQLAGQPVLTWFQGTTTAGTGEGEGEIFNTAYQRIATVHAGNGLKMDLHEFLLTDTGAAYLIAVAPVRLPGVARSVLNSVVQEIDVRTGLVLFQWDALDHLSPNDSYLYGPKASGHILDPFHTNSVAPDPSGNLIVSMRNTSAVYDISRSTGSVLWQLGGKHSTFKMGPGTPTAFQHDAIMQPNGEITIFDDGAGPPKVHSQSRGIEVSINQSTKTATLVRQVQHAPGLLADFEGSTELLPGGGLFLGWGQQPYFTEYDSSGRTVFDAHFATATASYRAYRLPWQGQAPGSPALAVGTTATGEPTLWESWNGATQIAAWQVLAGPNAGGLTPVGQYTKYHFESALDVPTGAPNAEVRALDASGNVLGTSPVRALPDRVQVFSGAALVSPAGMSGVPVGCYSSRECSLSARVTAGRAVLAQSGHQKLGAGSAGLLYFRLSPAARGILGRAASRRLRVTITVSDASGARAAAVNGQLIPFATSGTGPKRSYSPSATVQVVGGTEFVYAGTGHGAVLVACRSVAPCSASATIASGGAVIATGPAQPIGGQQLGFVPFTLTAAGRSLLSHAPGNQLPVAVTVSADGAQAGSQSALVAYR